MNRGRRDEREIARQVLERAAAEPVPALETLENRLPQILAEAARRRRPSFESGSAIDAAAVLARSAMPRLALVSALLAAIALATVLLDRRSGSATSGDDMLFVENGLTEDAIVESIVTLESAP